MLFVVEVIFKIYLKYKSFSMVLSFFTTLVTI